MRLPVLVILLTLCFVAPAVQAMDMDDSMIVTIESIGAQSGDRDIKYFFFTFKETYFKIPRATAIRYGIYDKKTPGGFNRQLLDTFEGRQVEVRVDREKGSRDWFIVKTMKFLK